MPKQHDWPAELKKPFAYHRIADQAVKGLVSTEGAAERISDAFKSEVERRVGIMAGFLDIHDEGPGLPQSQSEWLRLVYYHCRYWQIPAFEGSPQKRRGAKQKRTYGNRKELFDIIKSLMKKGMTVSAASAHVAKNPANFGRKFPTNPSTVRREFLRAKDECEIPF